VGLGILERKGERMKKMRAMKYEFRVGGIQRWGCPHIKIEYVIKICGKCGKKYFVCPVCIINSGLGELCPACEKKEAKS
jgi:hypothetical protein